MDAPWSVATPTFEMELAALRGVFGERQCNSSSSPERQSPAVNFSCLPPLRRVAPPPKLGEMAGGAPKRIRLVDRDGEVPFPRSFFESNWRRAQEVEQDPPEMSEDEEQGEEDCVSDDEVGSDPLEVLGSNVFQHVLSLLEPKSLATCLAVSTAWSKFAQADFLWDDLCKEAWAGKTHITPRALRPKMLRLRAFQISMAEAKRATIERQDLCSWVWELHFKEDAGDYWKQRDPYYHGGPLMRRIFHEDGHVTPEPMDQIWGGHECSWTIRKSRSRAGKMLVRINHWPTLEATRTSDWGWKMENAWVVYTSTNISTSWQKELSAAT